MFRLAEGDCDDLRGDVLVYATFSTGSSLGILASRDRDRLSELTGQNLGSLDAVVSDDENLVCYVAKVEGVAPFLERDDLDVINCGVFSRRVWMEATIEGVVSAYFAKFIDQKKNQEGTYRAVPCEIRRELLIGKYVVPLIKALEAGDDEEVCFCEAQLEDFVDGFAFKPYLDQFFRVLELVKPGYDSKRVSNILDLHVNRLLALMNESYNDASVLTVQISQFQ